MPHRILWREGEESGFMIRVPGFKSSKMKTAVQSDGRKMRLRDLRRQRCLTCTSMATGTCWRWLRQTRWRSETALKDPEAVSPSCLSTRFAAPTSKRPTGVSWWRAPAWPGPAPTKLSTPKTREHRAEQRQNKQTAAKEKPRTGWRKEEAGVI